MNPLETIVLDEWFEIVRHLVANILAAVLSWLVRDFQLRVDGLLVQSNAAGKLSEALVSVVACFVDHLRVEVFRLFVEESLAELPELVRIALQHGDASLMD